MSQSSQSPTGSCPHSNKLGSADAWHCLDCGKGGGTVVNPDGTGYTYEEKAAATNVDCRHRSVSAHKLQDDQILHQCLRCGKNWTSLSSEIANVIPDALMNLADDLSFRMGQTVAALADATADVAAAHSGTISAAFFNPQYADFLNMSEMAGLPVAEGSQIGYFGDAINVPETDPALIGKQKKQQQTLREATRQANEALARRRKAMDDAARAAASAFDMETEDKAAPVKLDTERKLKVVL